MSEWREFEKDDPNGYGRLAPFYIWVATEEKKEIRSMHKGGVAKGYWTHWMPIEEPELPEKGLHRCTNEDTGRDLICEEQISANGTRNFWLREPGEWCVHVVACPFCGFSLKEKT